jgi:serine/threonine-protein kinase
MTPEGWQQVGALFAQALEVPEGARAAWLDSADAPPDVRAEVRALLSAHAGASGFLDAPAAAPQPPPRQPRTDLVPGMTLGAYKLVRVLGQGGMGVVFEAEDTRLHRRVALKAVLSGSGDAADERRLRQEARAAAALVHPNIATIYALEEIGGRAYIASEYLEGETLRRVLERGALARQPALAIARALASALEAAHDRGVVHRDLKPENVLCLADGRVKILDFGLARLQGDGRPQTTFTRLTTEGLIAGTPGYMAPEQLEGLEVDARADQFALGVLVAEMVLGRNPFEAGTLASTIARVLASDGLSAAGDLSALGSDLAAVADRCTRRRREDRFATTGDVVRALDACAARLDTVMAAAADSRSTRATPAAVLDPHTGRRPPLWWWRFHQAAAAAVNWMMVVPAWLVHRQVPPGLPWFLACLAATIVAANVRLHLRFSAVVLPQHLAAQRAKTRGWVAIADWALIMLWAWAGVALMDASREWAVVFFAFAIGAALAVALIEPATTRAAFEDVSARLPGRSTDTSGRSSTSGR